MTTKDTEAEVRRDTETRALALAEKFSKPGGPSGGGSGPVWNPHEVSLVAKALVQSVNERAGLAAEVENLRALCLEREKLRRADLARIIERSNEVARLREALEACVGEIEASRAAMGVATVVARMADKNSPLNGDALIIAEAALKEKAP